MKIRSAVVLLFLIAGLALIAPKYNTLLREKRIDKVSAEFLKKGLVRLVDNEELRFEVNNDSQYLYARAVMWRDNQEGDIENISDGRRFSDYSEILFDADNNQEVTYKTDRNYFANPLIGLEGLYFTEPFERGADYGLNKDPEGEAFIRFTDDTEKAIRIDIYKIPLRNLSAKEGDQIRLCFYGSSVSPEFQVNSGGYYKLGQTYYGYSIPYTRFHTYKVRFSPDNATISKEADKSDESPPKISAEPDHAQIARTPHTSKSSDEEAMGVVDPL